MGVSGTAKCMKYLLFIFNFFFFLLGCTVIGLGVWGEVKLADYVKLTSIEFITGPRILMAAGVAIAIIAFLGCCGAWKENKCMLSLYLTFLVILLALEIAATVLAYKNSDEIKTQLEKDILEQIKKYPQDNLKAVNDLQSELECCGAKNYKDWVANTNYNNTAVPDTCCKKVIQECGKGPDVGKIYTEGCFTKLKDMIEKNLKPVGALAITMLVIQVLGIIFAVVLIWRID